VVSEINELYMSEESRFQFRLPEFEEGHPLFGYTESMNKITDEINKETDRGAALFGASILDEALQKILSEFFVSGPISNKLFRYPAPLSTFSARQNMCFALGLITKIEYNQCDIIRSIRNEFAHASAFSIDFNNKDIAELCSKFDAKPRTEAFKEVATDLNRIAFVITLSTLYWHWTQRLEFVKNNKRIPFTYEMG
jgi:mannitol operon repressor